jgi:hypothetical protein
MRKDVADWAQAAVAIAVVVFLFMLIHRMSTTNREGVEPPTLLHLASSQAIGEYPAWYGDERGRYALVEFADYQCPPCRYAVPDVYKVVDTSRGRLKFTFRNYPLHSVNPVADAAALAAEFARRHGKFWEVHDAFYKQQSGLNDMTIARILKEVGIRTPPTASDAAISSKAVEADIVDGDKCGVGVRGTPTFVLCLPDGSVYRLGALDQATGLMN